MVAYPVPPSVLRRVWSTVAHAPCPLRERLPLSRITLARSRQLCMALKRERPQPLWRALAARPSPAVRA